MTIAELLAQEEITLWGVCDFAPLADRLLPCRAAERLPQNPQRVLVALFPYRFPDKGARNLSRYAAVNDYHTAVGERLTAAVRALQSAYPTAHFAAFCDNSPINEVYAAAAAGLGVIGENGLLFHPVYGSYVFIGEIVTSLPLPVTGGRVRRCDGCGCCRTACPAGAIEDKTHCLSALTQKKGTLTEAQEDLIRQGGLCWGCDTCQEVCPMNQHARTAPHACFTAYHPYLTAADIESDNLKEQPYGWRGAAPLRRNLELLREK